jgi:glutamine amidotransferase
MPPKIIIIDYGAGNLRSVARAVAHAGYEPCVTQDPYDVAHADAVILPGVGAAADTMRNLREHEMVEPVREYIASGRPFFGVCMGQQALLSVSEEGGEHACLNVIAGRVKRLPGAAQQAADSLQHATNSKQQAANGSRLKVPHMGWNQVRQAVAHPIFEGIPDESYFYFVHSYYPDPDDASVVIGETDYGVTFASVLARDNIVATQFHPEKSGEMGLRMYENFLRGA